MTICEQITELFPVRKSAAQKKAFRQWVMAEIAGLGYKAQLEQSDNGRQQNIVVGDPEHAQVTFTAHYDTPASFFLPNLMTPRNRLFRQVRQIGMILLYVLFGAVVGVPVWLLSDDGQLGFVAGWLVYMACALMAMIGPANKNNVNDNTSGVAAVLEIMSRIPAEDRAKAAFILFDDEEKGLLGSKAYAKAHPAVKEQGFVVNLDCVGDGEHVLLISSEKARSAEAYTALVQGMEGASGRELHVFPMETSTGSSDHKSFKTSNVIYACRVAKGIGFYCSKIHTKKDIVCEQINLDFLADGLSAFVSKL